MEPYIGVKLLNAKPMNRQDFSRLLQEPVLVLSKSEERLDEGYLVEYLDGGKPNHPDFKGYISWSPKDVFEAAYRKTSGMSFGLAIEALKKGYRVARAGWNGKNMWLSYSPGHINLPAERFWSAHNKEYAESNGGTATVEPSIMMKNASGNISYWQPSSSDMFADDWSIV